MKTKSLIGIFIAFLAASFIVIFLKHQQASHLRLIKADQAGNLVEVKHALDEGIDVNTHDSMGKTALMYAVAGENTEYETKNY